MRWSVNHGNQSGATWKGRLVREVFLLRGLIPIHEKPDTNRASRIKPQPGIEATIDVFNSGQLTIDNWQLFQARE